MGPLFFQSGERRSPASQASPDAGFNGAALFQSGEHVVANDPDQFTRASMGPLFFRAENIGRGFPSASVTPRLQWGRSFSERRTFDLDTFLAELAGFNGAALFQSGERCPAAPPQHPAVPASMGPLSFRAENASLRAKLGGFQQLQWGRSFSERRTHTLGRWPDRLQSLQWGRSFSERRTSRWQALGTRARRFNGAALFQSGERGNGS